jgi:hypothetical protein
MSDMSWLLAALALLLQQSFPQAYPRPGATRMLENDRVIVWNISWLKQAYPVHRHVYDHVGVYYEPGDRIITSTEGERRDVHTEPWNISFQLRGVTHAEEGASDEPLRAVFIQMKQEPRETGSAEVAQPSFPADGPSQRLDNDRAIVWEYGAATSAPGGTHRHAHDAVVVSFDAAGSPQARYVERGTVHETDLTAGSARTFVFEIR